MKVAILTNSTMASPSISAVDSHHEVVGIGIGLIGTEDERQYRCLVSSERIPITTFVKSNHESEMANWLKACRADVVLVYTFNFKIGATCLRVPQYGFFNFHPGDLPEERGNPLFWTILNRRDRCALTVHKMTEEIDCGPIYGKTTCPINDETTLGAALTTLSYKAVAITLKLLEDLEMSNGKLATKVQNHSKGRWFPNPRASHIEIDWDKQTAEQIQALVNACNPFCEGAKASIDEREVRIIQASPASVSIATLPPSKGIPLSLRKDGLYVACRDETILRVDILCDVGGYCTGQKWMERRASFSPHFTA